MEKTNFKIDWIVIDEISLGPIPTKNSHLNKLKEENIKSILSLCDLNKYIPNHTLDEDFNHKQIILPDHKEGKLPLISELEYCIKSLKELTQMGKTYIHCIASMERSPLVCMAWLIRMHDLTPQESLDFIMQAHKGTSPLPGQLSLLKEIYENN